MSYSNSWRLIKNTNECKLQLLKVEFFIRLANFIIKEKTIHSNDNILQKFVLEKASKISKKSALTLKIGKEAFYKQAEMTLSEAYDYASSVMVKNMLNYDAEEGIEAFISRRKPNWQDK